MSKATILKPRMSEKTYAASQELNTYVFEIVPGSNKDVVARAVESQFEVSVVSVRITKTPGKNRRSYKRGGRVVRKGMSSGVNKAYVTLKEGDKLPIFAAIEEAEEKAEKAEAKAAKKKEKK
jgi:large subunit ribosomal protein L23